MRYDNLSLCTSDPRVYAGFAAGYTLRGTSQWSGARKETAVHAGFSMGNPKGVCADFAAVGAEVQAERDADRLADEAEASRQKEAEG